jgi:cation diffusion facilitator CzcD-associated flavoprotein CzcO
MCRAPITKPYVPDWAGLSDYKGTFIRPRDPAIDVKGKRVLVIGSATAATVVPAFCDAGAQVTMLQRSPTYFCHPNQNSWPTVCARSASTNRPFTASCQVMHDQDVLTKRCQTEPDVVFEELKALVRAYAGLRVQPNSPQVSRVAAAPWRSRWRPVPARRGWPCAGGDRHDRPLYRKGVRTASGELEADIVVACTGFRLSVMGDIPFAVDGKAGQLARYGQLSRHDVHRRSQPRLGHGLFPGELDAACCWAISCASCSTTWTRAVRSGSTWRYGPRTRDGAWAVDRARQLQSRLSHARTG